MFEECLFETCHQSGWRLHAYTLMRNNFHLAVATPRANLTAGMHWLQSTFAVRYNRGREGRGHLFQSRYQALLVEPGMSLLRVVDHIHLNPVRAGIVGFEQLAGFRWGSYRRFVRNDRPEFLDSQAWRPVLNDFADTPEGWRHYREHLACLLTLHPGLEVSVDRDLGKGWAIGSPVWRRDIARRFAASSWPVGSRNQEDLDALAWTEALDRQLALAGRTRANAAVDWKGAAWKVAVAAGMRRTSTATNGWIARELHMGTPNSVSVYLSQRRRAERESDPLI